MTTKRETILAAIRTALTGTTGVGTRIWRTRVEPIPREESPAIVVEPLTDSARIETNLATLTWSMTVRVSVIVRGAIPDQVADPIVQSLHSKLMADYTLGGYAMDILPLAVTFNFSEADGAAGEIQCDYRVMYRTTLTDLAS
jgi:hypothetical protein